MEAYTDFASVYDIFMDDTPYKEWADFLEELIETYGISKPVCPQRDDEKEPERAENVLESEKNLVLDLGCGT